MGIGVAHSAQPSLFKFLHWIESLSRFVRCTSQSVVLSSISRGRTTGCLPICGFGGLCRPF